MSDLGAIVLACCIAAGALAARPAPLAVAAVGVGAAFMLRRPLLLCVAAAVLASGLAADAWDGLTAVVPAETRGVATLVTDPATEPGAVRAEVRLHGRRLDAWFRGDDRWRVATLLAGERVELAGRVAPFPEGVAHRLASRHLAGRLAVKSVGAVHRADPLSSVTNALRRTLSRGAESLSPRDRSLFGGFVLGDDRGQDPLVVDDFRASGLSHLLVVSGENVAFVLALAAPLVRRGSMGARLGFGLVVLVLFGVLTRWEPSVLRAEAMAAISMVAVTIGRPVSTIRVLALAVGGLLLIDPLLVRSFGFALSVGACAGIAVGAKRLEARLPGPRVVRPLLAVTLAAQLGVAPLLLSGFGEMPLATVPANLAAVPAAGPLMVWGLTAGVVAGVVGGPVAVVAHFPTRVLVGWVATVARVAAGSPLPTIGWVAALTIAGVAGAAWLVPRHRRLLVVVALAFLGARALVPGPAAPLHTRAAAGVEVYRAGGATVVVVDGATAGRALAGLRAAGVHRTDAVVARRRGSADAVRVLAARLRPRLVIGPAGTRVAHLVTPADGAVARAGPLRLEFHTAGNAVEVEVRRQR
jgi:competence protein ComEC